MTTSVAVGDHVTAPVPTGTVITRTGGSTPPINPADRDALARMTELLTSFGLASLAGKIMGYLQEGMGQDSIMLELENTAEWKARFSANDARRAAGKPVLSPAEYLATERSYAQIMAEAGVPAGFYDQYSDFQALLTKDVSPAELQGRVKAATDFVRAADPAATAYMKKWYTEGDLVAYALDPKRAAPLVGRAFQAASVAGIAGSDGLGLSQSTAERLAEAGVNEQNAREGFGQISRDRQTIDLLSGLDGQASMSADELAAGAFLNDATTNEKVSKLKSAERGRFSGTSGVGKGSLGKSSGL